jgi:hypothetical protein
MPVPYLKKLQAQTGKTMSELETMWDECKAAATKANKDQKHYWGFVVYLLKQKLGIKESLFQEFVDLEFGDFEDHPEVHMPDVASLAMPAVELPPEPVPEPQPVMAPHDAATTACTPRNLVSELFSARDKAHQLHLRAKSFLQHMTLGDFYEGIIDLADQIAETVQGKYGVMEPVVATSVPGEDANAFIAGLATWLDHVAHACVPPEDTFLHNLIDEVQALTYRTKYKLDNLQ